MFLFLHSLSLSLSLSLSQQGDRLIAGQLVSRQFVKQEGYWKFWTSSKHSFTSFQIQSGPGFDSLSKFALVTFLQMQWGTIEVVVSS